MTAPRRGRPPKPPDEVRTVRVTVLLTERERATLKRACGGRGVASLLVRVGLREAASEAPDPREKRRRDRALVEAGVGAATGGVCGLGDAEADAMIARVDAMLKQDVVP